MTKSDNFDAGDVSFLFHALFYIFGFLLAWFLDMNFPHTKVFRFWTVWQRPLYTSPNPSSVLSF